MYRLQPIKKIGESSIQHVQLLNQGGLSKNRAVLKEFTKIGSGYIHGGKITPYVKDDIHYKKGGKTVKPKSKSKKDSKAISSSSKASNTNVIKINIGKSIKPSKKKVVVDSNSLRSFHSYPRTNHTSYTNFHPDVPINNPTNSYLSDRRPVFGGSYQLRPSEALLPNRISPINENILVKMNDSEIYHRSPISFSPDKLPNKPTMTPDSMIDNSLSSSMREEYKENEQMLTPLKEVESSSKTYSKDELEGMTLISLKNLAKRRGLPSSGKKSELISLILRNQ